MEAKRWYQRLFDRLLNENVNARTADAMVKGTSKHGRARMKPQNLEHKRKVLRLMAKRSRRINRKQL